MGTVTDINIIQIGASVQLVRTYSDGTQTMDIRDSNHTVCELCQLEDSEQVALGYISDDPKLRGICGDCAIDIDSSDSTVVWA